MALSEAALRLHEAAGNRTAVLNCLQDELTRLGLSGSLIRPVRMNAIEPDGAYFSNGSALSEKYNFPAELAHLGAHTPVIVVPIECTDGQAEICMFAGETLVREDLPVFRILAGHLKLALMHSPQDVVRADTQRHAETLAGLYELALELAGNYELNDLLNRIVLRASTLLGAAGGSLYVNEPEQRQVRLIVELNGGAENLIGTTLAYGYGAAGQVALHEKPLIVDNYQNWPHKAKAFEQIITYDAVLSAPMIWQNELIGVLQVFDDAQIRQFQRADLELLVLFANLAASVLTHANLLIAERQKRQEAESLTRATTALVSSLDLNEVLNTILRRLQDLVIADSATIFLLERHQLRVVAIQGSPVSQELLGKCFPVEDDLLFQTLSNTRELIVLENALEDERFQRWGNVDYINPGWACH